MNQPSYYKRPFKRTYRKNYKKKYTKPSYNRYIKRPSYKSNVPLGKELKCFDYGQNIVGNLYGLGYITGPLGLADNWAGGGCVGTNFNSIIQGTKIMNRIGNKIQMKSTSVKMHLFTTSAKLSAAGIESVSIRMMIIYDKHPDGAYPGLEDLFGYYNGTSQQGLINFNVSTTCTTNYKILRDKRYELNAGNLLCTDINEYIDFKRNPLLTNYDTSTGLVDDIIDGALYLVMFTSLLGSNLVAAAFDNLAIRTRYWDM